MGGPGSGRHGGILTDKCEDYRPIDLAWLKRKGVLESWRWETINWSRGGEVHSSIQVKREHTGVRFRYHTRKRGDEWQDVNELMPFAYTRTNFRGRRRWFKCLSCGRNCRVLYGGTYYRCRICWGLRYESQYEPAWVRPISKAQKIRERLGGSLSLDDPFPEKPKGMHWKTYIWLKRQDDFLTNRWAALTMDWMGRFSG